MHTPSKSQYCHCTPNEHTQNNTRKTTNPIILHPLHLTHPAQHASQ